MAMQLVLTFAQLQKLHLQKPVGRILCFTVETLFAFDVFTRVLHSCANALRWLH